MRRSKMDLGFRQLLAPMRLVINEPMRNGYELGLAATADHVDMICPRFTLNEAELRVLEQCIEALFRAHEAHRGRTSLSHDVLQFEMLPDVAPVPLPVEKLRESQRRLTEIARAVADGDRALTALAQHDLQLVVSTREEAVVSFGDVDDAVDVVAEVSVRRLGHGDRRTSSVPSAGCIRDQHQTRSRSDRRECSRIQPSVPSSSERWKRRSVCEGGEEADVATCMCPTSPASGRRRHANSP